MSTFTLHYDWSPVLHVHDCELKFQKFHDIANMLEKFLPITRTKVRQSSKSKLKRQNLGMSKR
jgi:hypothetical protein